jgi:hypothetical protein
VKLINTDGMVFLGPGSEWFWTAASGIVLAVTFFAIYRQLRLQRSASAIEQLERIEREYASELFMRHFLKLHLAARDGVDPADLPNQATAPILNFWERVGSLARRGHLDMRQLWEGGSAFQCQADWVMLAPSVKKIRRELRNPAIGEQFEWLAGVMEAWARKAGVALDDATQQAARRERAIATCEGAIRTFEALRAVTLVQPVDVPAASVPSAPAASES